MEWDEGEEEYDDDEEEEERAQKSKTKYHPQPPFLIADIRHSDAVIRRQDNWVNVCVLLSSTK